MGKIKYYVLRIGSFLTLKAMQQEQREVPKLQSIIHKYLVQKIAAKQLDKEQILQGVPAQYKEVLLVVYSVSDIK